MAEFKVHAGGGKRILAILHGREYVLTNGFMKGADLATEFGKGRTDLLRGPRPRPGCRGRRIKGMTDVFEESGSRPRQSV